MATNKVYGNGLTEEEKTLPNVGNVYGTTPTFQDYVNAQYGQAVQDAYNQKQQVYQQAAITRQRDMANANTVYQQSKAGYGVQAEQANAMGLQMSGVNDYANASAYGAYRSNVSNANAQEVYSQRQADATYANAKTSAMNSAYGQLGQAVYNDEQSKKQGDEAAKSAYETNYKTFYENFYDGAYDNFSNEQLLNMAKAYGLNDADIQKLDEEISSTTPTTFEAGEWESFKNKIDENVNSSRYDTAMDILEIAYNGKKKDTNFYNTYADLISKNIGDKAIDVADYNNIVNDVTTALKNDKISKDGYNKIMSEIKDSVEVKGISETQKIGIDGTYYRLSYNGKYFDYRGTELKKADADISEQLTKIVGNKKDSYAIYSGRLYRRDASGIWYVLKNKNAVNFLIGQ